jgi:hypothetical protein
VTGNFNPWIRFFAEAVVAQADDAVGRIDELIKMCEQDAAILHRGHPLPGTPLNRTADLR